MKCDELKPITVTDECGSYRVYNKSEVDAAIAELKAQVNGFENRANLWEYNALNEHNAAVAVRMENAKLKAKLAEKDKEIAELRNEADVYKAKYEQEYDIAVHNEKQLSVMRIELRHHKFKRCLDKAELCELWYYRTKDLHRTKDIEDKYYMGSPLFKKRLFKLWLYEKWTNKWLELANKFKEAK